MTLQPIPPGSGPAAPAGKPRRPPRPAVAAMLARAEASTGQETWLISYTDMVTLLLTVFVLLVSITGLGPPRAAEAPPPAVTPAPVEPDLPGTEPVLPDLPSPPPSPPPVPEPAPKPAAEPAAGGAVVPGALSWMRDRAQELEELALHAENGALAGAMEVRRTETAVVVQLRDGILFAPGRADLVPAGHAVLVRLARILADMPGEIDVEGHTDDRPIANGRFASNWELSSARAARVARDLVAAGISPQKVRAVGYAHTRPVAANDSPEGRQANRRVVLSILGRAPADPGPAPTAREPRP